MEAAGGGSPFQRVNLRNLEPDLNNILIVGVIIGKQRPRKFVDVKAKETNSYKIVWNFTFRDSLQDYINVAYWSNNDAAYEANDRFHTGDVGEYQLGAF